MLATTIKNAEDHITRIRVNIAQEWAKERGMKNTEDMTDDDWIAVYTMLVTKVKYRQEF